MINEGQWTRIQGTAAGTTTVLNRPGELSTIFIPASKTGTVTLYDSESGTTAASEVAVVVNDTVDFPTAAPVNIPLKNGLIAVVGGTTDLTLIVK